jgi:hypothetical protein
MQHKFLAILLASIGAVAEYIAMAEEINYRYYYQLRRPTPSMYGNGRRRDLLREIRSRTVVHRPSS